MLASLDIKNHMNNEERRNSPMKKLAALLAALLVLSCGTTFLAAPSPELGGSDSPEIGGTDSPELGGDEDEVVVEIKGGTAVDSTGKTFTPVINVVKPEVKAEAEAKAEEKSKGSQLLAIVDVKVEGATGAVKITFDVDGIKASDEGKIFILHEKENGYWETIHPDKVEDGKITATFGSLSPVAIVKKADTATTLPKTGAPVVLPVVALICAAGAVGCAKKVKFN